ncbi:hypothetical protein MHYP_G00091970 [Metynnis hypsauchen]
MGGFLTDRERRYNSLHSREGDWAAEKPVALPGQDRGNAPVSAREGVSYCEGMWGPAQCCAQVCRATVGGGGATSGPRARTNECAA